MLKSIFATTILLFFTVASPLVLAEEVPANALPLSKIVENLQSKGYSVVREIEFENGLYVTKAFDPQGQTSKIRIDPISGKIVEPKAKATTLSLLDVLRRLENGGFHGISKISFERGQYEAIALDRDGKKVDLDIDGKTGEITKDWF